jgi:hypothetical protein
MIVTAITDARPDPGQVLRERAFRAGQQARQRGQPREANPYRSPFRTLSSDARMAAWEWGWDTRDRAMAEQEHIRSTLNPTRT